jgi:hypothetical protein
VKHAALPLMPCPKARHALQSIIAIFIYGNVFQDIGRFIDSAISLIIARGMSANKV